MISDSIGLPFPFIVYSTGWLVLVRRWLRTRMKNGVKKDLKKVSGLSSENWDYIRKNIYTDRRRLGRIQHSKNK